MRLIVVLGALCEVKWAISVGVKHEVSYDERVAGGLWSLFVGDALAMPVHWYYGGPDQIRRNYGALLTGYEKAVHPFPESIMQLSNTGGAGRGGDEGDIIGSVILHGKKSYWQRGGQYHYHHTLQAGENTLEASLVRVLLRSFIKNGGFFSVDSFRSMYTEFMTTPDTHNDTYASTCHRMFFKNRQQGLPLDQCPDNDGHNVDTMDGLVLPAVVLLCELAAGQSKAEAIALAVGVLQVTRQSSKLQDYIGALADILHALFKGEDIEGAIEANSPGIQDEVIRRTTSGQNDPMVACYIDDGFPALLFFGNKYAKLPVTKALLASANAGGENVHRGAVLGTLLGAASGVQTSLSVFRSDLISHFELKMEISAVIAAIKARRDKALRSDL